MSQSTDVLNYTLHSFSEDFPPLTEKFKAFCQTHQINDETLFGMEVSLEELIVNSFSYGDVQGKIEVSIGISQGELQVVIEDNAPPFNPLEDAPKPVIDGGLDERQIGGLGIHLAKSFNDRIEYAQLEKGNRITLFKSL